jgi:hypothetical protein
MQYSTINHNEAFTDKGIQYKMVTSTFSQKFPYWWIKWIFLFACKRQLKDKLFKLCRWSGNFSTLKKGSLSLQTCKFEISYYSTNISYLLSVPSITDFTTPKTWMWQFCQHNVVYNKSNYILFVLYFSPTGHHQADFTFIFPLNCHFYILVNV